MLDSNYLHVEGVSTMDKNDEITTAPSDDEERFLLDVRTGYGNNSVSPDRVEARRRAWEERKAALKR